MKYILTIAPAYNSDEHWGPLGIFAFESLMPIEALKLSFASFVEANTTKVYSAFDWFGHHVNFNNEDSFEIYTLEEFWTKHLAK